MLTCRPIGRCRLIGLPPESLQWEPVALLQRLVVTGFVLLIEQQFVRVVTAIVVSVTYFVMFLLASPYEDEQADVMSSACQVCSSVSEAWGLSLLRPPKR